MENQLDPLGEALMQEYINMNADLILCKNAAEHYETCTRHIAKLVSIVDQFDRNENLEKANSWRCIAFSYYRLRDQAGFLIRSAER